MNRLLYFFPFQLTLHHLKNNLALLALWAILLAMILGGIGRIYGIHYLFLEPEYLNEVSPLSYFIVGLAFGNFTMAYQITSYILVGHRFSFVGVLERPFAKYSVNNSLIPIVAFIIYIFAITIFHISNDQISAFKLLSFILFLTLGVISMISLMFLYFKLTNKDIFKYLAGSVDKRLRKNVLSRERAMNRLKEGKEKKFPVKTYLDLKLKVRSCEDFTDFYDKEALIKVFDQNHFNSVVLETLVILSIFSMGILIENPFVQIPAAASSILLFSILMMFIGAVSFWFREWSIVLVIGVFILANLSVRLGIISKVNTAKGLDYEQPKAVYSLETMKALLTEENIVKDKQQMLGRLEKWKAKQPVERPPLVILSVSGGGQRAALWAMRIMQGLDSTLNNELLNKTFLITGASGGMIGAAGFREMKMQWPDLTQEKQSDEYWLKRMGRDNLNHVIFSLLVNDLFFKFQQYEYEGKKYIKDRGYIFESNLIKNLDGILDKKLSEYKEAEDAALIPTMILSPIIANDGRKIFISTQPVSFMTGSEEGQEYYKIRGIDFQRFFEMHGAEKLHFVSALRMSASFPYITPVISLPSEPRMEIMDAGISDNFGIADALHFVYSFKKWIEENTSGIILIQIRDTKKNSPIEPKPNKSILDRFSNPISSVYNNLANIQDINNDSRLLFLKENLEIPLELVSFEYDTYKYDQLLLFESEMQENKRNRIKRASLSWHLTDKEKEHIIQHGNTRKNIMEFKKVKSLILDPGLNVQKK